MTADRGGNLWWTTCREQVEAPPLAQDRTVDLAVIGGGFTGGAAALEAARQGATVCLLEAEEIGAGGSGRNVGLVNAGLWLTPEAVVAQLGRDAGTRLIEILGRAPAQVFDLIARAGIDCEATPAGTLHLAHAASGLRALRQRHEQGLRHGAPLELLDADETARRTGTQAFGGALLDPRAGTIQPLAYCRGLARTAAEAGAAIHARSAVTSVEFDAGRWVLQANGCRVTARALLMATNAYHHGITDPFRPAHATVSYSQFATPPLPDTARARILPQRQGCWDTALVMTSFRVDQAGRLILGGIGNADGTGSPVHRGWARQTLRRLFPDLGDPGFDHIWHGKIAMTGDHLPRIVEFGPSALACFGYSGRGIGPGTVFGTQATMALLGDAPELLPIAPITAYSENLTNLKTLYYEVGATLTHLIPPLRKL